MGSASAGATLYLSRQDLELAKNTIEETMIPRDHFLLMIQITMSPKLRDNNTN